MVFRKDIEPRCSYCRYASPAEEGIMICRKKGLKPENDHCRSFRYDPLRRVPPKPAQVDFTQFDDRDYTL